MAYNIINMVRLAVAAGNRDVYFFKNKIIMVFHRLRI